MVTAAPHKEASGLRPQKKKLKFSTAASLNNGKPMTGIKQNPLDVDETHCLVFEQNYEDCIQCENSRNSPVEMAYLMDEYYHTVTMTCVNKTVGILTDVSDFLLF